MPGPLTKPRQNTRHVVRIALAAALALIGGALVIVFFVSDRGPVGPLASCFDFAEEQTGAAESPACAPFILPEGEAARLLESMTLERLDLGFYVVADEDTWAAISKSEIWRTISAATSAVLGVHGVATDVYFIVTPASREESALLLQGDYPEERIVATAIYNERKTKRLAPADVPGGHFTRSYRLNVR